MTNLLDLLSNIEKNNTQLLLCELPKNLIDDLNIQSNGTVNLETLLKICQRIKKSESIKAKQMRHKHIMNLIFNSGIAANFEHKKRL